MVLSEIVHTFSHDRVAHAAALSLGRDFLETVEHAASHRGMPAGKFIAASVRRFETDAPEHEKFALQQAVAGSDMPLLHGLALIVAHEIETSHRHD